MHPWVLVQLQVVVRLQMLEGSDCMEPPAAGDEGWREEEEEEVSAGAQVCSWFVCVCVC